MNDLLSIALPVAVSVLLSACTSPEDRPAPEADGPVCLRGDSFTTDGMVPVAEQPSAGAIRVHAMRLESHEGCERFVIDLAANDGGPATSAGQVHAEVLRDLSVVRIHLRDVEQVETDATDATFEGPLAGAAYAVSSDEGRWTYIDLHLFDAAEVHVNVLQAPARILLDLRPGGSPLPAPAVSGPRVVLLEPRPGEATYPLRVTGYTRTFEANVVLRIEQNGKEYLETFTTATAWVDAWGHFAFTIEEGPSGPVDIRVGEYSAKDGTWEGVVAVLHMTE